MKRKSESFPKAERLCGLKAIARLFNEGESINTGNIRVFYLLQPVDPTLPAIRVLISVSKRLFKKAVTRNLIRRRIKEAYRKNKFLLSEFMEASSRRADIALIWQDTANTSFSDIEKAIKEIIKKIIRTV